MREGSYWTTTKEQKTFIGDSEDNSPPPMVLVTVAALYGSNPEILSAFWGRGGNKF